jgi:hypothetical protein
MKKFFIALFIGLFGFIGVSSARVEMYKATSFSTKFIYNGYWTNWSEWSRSDVTITFYIESDIVTISSSTPQTYRVLSYNGQFNDADGGYQKFFSVIDQDNDRGTIRLRVYGSTRQLYVEFANIMWVYNVYLK